MRKDDDSGLILAVDDHRMNLLALKGILINAGYGFLEASSGEEAIAKVKKHHPDLILMDINMGGMDGYHTTLAIHDIPGHESTPVLFLSGSTEEDDIVRCFTSGGVDYVSKPVRKYELLARIETHLDIQNLQQKLINEQQKTNAIAENMLPANLLGQIKNGVLPEPKFHEEVTVLFTDFENFTSLTRKLGASETLHHLKVLFYAFDEILASYRLERIKTIGDGYLAIAGIHSPKELSCLRVAAAVFKLNEFLSFYNQMIGAEIWNLKAGAHKGAVISGVIGYQKIAFDIWGEAVNLTSRIVNTPSPGQLCVTEDVFDMIQSYVDSFEKREEMLDGVGMRELYFISSLKSSLPEEIIDYNKKIDFQTIMESADKKDDFILKIFGERQNGNKYD